MKFIIGESGEEVPENPCQLLKVPMIQEGAVAFNRQEEFIPCSQRDRIFYCHQDEICTRVCPTQFDVIGSDDATTCIILLLRCLASNKVFVTHLSDSRTVKKICYHVKDFIEKGVVGNEGGDVEVYLSGGIDVDSCLDCLFEVLQMFKSITTLHTDTERKLILKLCNVATLNSKVAEDSGMNSIPIVQGMAFKSNLSTCVPCHFLDHQRGPELEVRLFSWASGFNSCNDYDDYDDVYDYMESSDFEDGFGDHDDSDSDSDDEDDADVAGVTMNDLTIWDDKLQSTMNNSVSVPTNNISSVSGVECSFISNKTTNSPNDMSQTLPPSSSSYGSERKCGEPITYDGNELESGTGTFIVRLPSKPMTPQSSVMNMTDSQILASFSTTPWTERSRFSKDIRSVFELAQDERRLRTIYHQSSNSIRKWKHVGIVGNGEQQWQMELDSQADV